MHLSYEANQWLLNGERGISSEMIFSVLSCINILKSEYRIFNQHPYDPDDFLRCEKLLRTATEFRVDFDKMKSLSKAWSGLVDHWDEIVKQFEEEVPGVFDHYIPRWSAPKTYALMKNATGR